MVALPERLLHKIRHDLSTISSGQRSEKVVMQLQWRDWAFDRVNRMKKGDSSKDRNITYYVWQ
jgi:hypothetical protein